MSDHRFTVYRIGVHPRDVLEPEALELERVGARVVVLEKGFYWENMRLYMANMR